METDEPKETQISSEDVILSGEIVQKLLRIMEWRVEKSDRNGELKLIIFGVGEMRSYDYSSSLMNEIRDQLVETKYKTLSFDRNRSL